MTRWPAHYVIGLTGNIGTGKSVVRKMLEHLGAFGIDADGLAHAAMARGAPAHAPVVKAFGEWILGADGQINRATLGGVVFANPQALARLEAIVHPIVSQAIDLLISRATQPVVVVEAIKLLESGLATETNAVWVVNAPPEAQLARLTQKRKMARAAARQRIEAQPAQRDKMARAHVVVENGGSFDETWAQVQAAWPIHEVVARPARRPTPSAPSTEVAPAPGTRPLAPARPRGLPREAAPGQATVRRGRPGDAEQIARFIYVATAGGRRLSRADVMAAFGEKAFLLVEADGAIVGLAGWQVENLVARVDDLYFSPDALAPRLLPSLIEAVETHSRELQGEASLVFMPERMGADVARVLSGAGYVPQAAETIGVAAWREAIEQSQPPGTRLMFKKLREDRVLRPI